MKNKPEPTRLDGVVSRAVAVLRLLRKLEGKTKLTGAAFVTEALANAQCSPSRLSELDQQIDRAGADQTRAFVKRMVNQLRASNWPRPPSKWPKLLRAYGTEQAGTQLAEMQSSVAEAIALAASLCAKRFPDDFGDIEDWDAHQKQIASANKQLAALYDEMQGAWAAPDLEININDLTPTQRDLGLLLCYFRRWPDVSLSRPDWPVSITRNSLWSEPSPRAIKGKKAAQPEDADEDEDNEPANRPPPAPLKSPRRPIERRKRDDGRHSGPPVGD